MGANHSMQILVAYSMSLAMKQLQIAFKGLSWLKRRPFLSFSFEISIGNFILSYACQLKKYKQVCIPFHMGANHSCPFNVFSLKHSSIGLSRGSLLSCLQNSMMIFREFRSEFRLQNLQENIVKYLYERKPQHVVARSTSLA